MHNQPYNIRDGDGHKFNNKTELYISRNRCSLSESLKAPLTSEE